MSPILVCGLPRSGTSMVAGLLALCGAWTGKTVGKGPSNPRGFFENRVLREQVDKALLRELGVDELGVDPLPALEDVPRAATFASRVLSLLSAEGYAGEGPWLFKDAKLTLLWPQWQEAFPRARWVIVRRPVEDVVRSCLNTHFMRQHSKDRSFWEEFASEYEARLRALLETSSWTREVSADEVVSNPMCLEDLVAELGLAWHPRAVRKFVSPRFWGASRRR